MSKVVIVSWRWVLGGERSLLWVGGDWKKYIVWVYVKFVVSVGSLSWVLWVGWVYGTWGKFIVSKVSNVN